MPLSAAEMTLPFLFMTVTCSFVKANSLENVYTDNGWRPTSIEKVLELQRGFNNPPILHLVKTLRNSHKQLARDDSENEKNVEIIHTNELHIQPVEDHKIVPAFENHEEDSNDYHELIKIIQPSYKEMIRLEDAVSNWNTQNYFKSNQQRQAKKIRSPDIVAHLNNAITKEMKNNEHNDETNEGNVETMKNKAYEVKENIKEENQATSVSQKLLYDKSFKYEIPVSVKIKNNFTANLLKILANYNIRTSDSLHNYDLSLRQKSRNSHYRDFVFMHVPEKRPMKYNNANHLPIDPLLAVYLSNYGHYIPSLYGIHGGYNNLYGYLASNNIHNNKPFGSYKIFSDTDYYH